MDKAYRIYYHIYIISDLFLIQDCSFSSDLKLPVNNKKKGIRSIDECMKVVHIKVLFKLEILCEI